jgi:hypothetical protein
LLRVVLTPWVESKTTNRPVPSSRGSHTTIEVCGSNGLLWVVAVVYVASTVTSAPRSAASGSPITESVGNDGLTTSGA